MITDCYPSLRTFAKSKPMMTAIQSSEETLDDNQRTDDAEAVCVDLLPTSIG